MSQAKKNKASCSVAVCPSPYNATYHTFPKDPDRLQAWMAACKRKDPINIKTGRICSNHFRDEDYDRDLRNELLQLPTRKLLKPNSIPTLKLLPEEILFDESGDFVDHIVVEKPEQPKKLGRKRKKVEKRTQKHVETEFDAFEEEFDILDEEEVKEEFVLMRARIKYLEDKLRKQDKELIKLRKFKRNVLTEAEPDEEVEPEEEVELSDST